MASNAKTRRLDYGAAVDRISNLPRNLKHCILDRLPAEDVARTSILSKAWRNIWIMHPTLVFDDQFFSQLVSKKFPMEDKQVQISEVLRTISNILLIHSGPILEFHLIIPRNLLLHQCIDLWYQCIDLWIKTISSNGIRKLDLYNRAPIAYKMPSYFFSCTKLTDLHLGKCILKPPFNFGGFCKLIEVNLVMVTISGDMSFGTQLKKLALTACSGVEHLVSHLKNCNNLTELTLADIEEIDWRLFECTPKMQLNTLKLMLRRVTNVIKEGMNLDKLFGTMPRINALYLDGFFLESLERDAALLKRPITTLKKLSLECVQLENVVHIHKALCLIRSFPNLRYLRLILDAEGYWNDDMDSLIPSVLTVDMIPHQLETVEILDVFGSATELQFVKLLLASSTSLKWIKLHKDSFAVYDPIKELAILQKLLQFPRASTAAQIIWE